MVLAYLGDNNEALALPHLAVIGWIQHHDAIDGTNADADGIWKCCLLRGKNGVYSNVYKCVTHAMMCAGCALLDAEYILEEVIHSSWPVWVRCNYI